MLYGQDRNQIRQMYFNAWQKHKNKLAVEPLEQVIINVILLHPEYQPQLEKEDATGDRDYLPEMGESNPFLHMGLHIAIHEQLSTNQPAGITAAHQQLMARLQDAHEVEHKMMECLAETLWEGQRNNAEPNINQYLSRVKKL